MGNYILGEPAMPTERLAVGSGSLVSGTHQQKTKGKIDAFDKAFVRTGESSRASKAKKPKKHVPTHGD